MRVTEEYAKLQRDLHDTNIDYGQSSEFLFPLIRSVIDQVQPKSILDYGCGKGRLKTLLNSSGMGKIPYVPYDPAFPEYGDAIPADMVCCIDVLEHIEPACLEDVLADIRRVTIRTGMLTVHVGAAKKHLSDGRNAHLIQESSHWWLPRICKYFDIDYLGPTAGGFFMVVCPYG